MLFTHRSECLEAIFLSNSPLTLFYPFLTITAQQVIKLNLLLERARGVILRSSEIVPRPQSANLTF